MKTTWATWTLLVLLTTIGSLPLISPEAAGVPAAALALAAAPEAVSVTAVAPGSAPNDLDTPIAITGTGFTSGVTITLGATELVDVGWVTTTTLTATVPWGLGPGVYTLTVFEPGGGSGSLPNAFTVTEGFGVWNGEEMYGGRINQVVVHPLTPTVVYALANEIGLFRSPDSGATWSTIVTAPPVYARLAVDPLFPHWLYLSPNWASADGGDTWVQLDVPANAGPNYYPHPLISGTLYNSNSWPGYCVGLWKSLDYGQSWITITHGSGLTDTCIYDMAFHPTDPQIAVAASGQLYRTGDGGTTWNQIWGESVRAAAFDPFSTHELWISSDGMWKSAGPDYTNWTPVALPPGACTEAIAFAPATWGGAYSDTVFLTDEAGRSFKTTDGGDSWHDFGPTVAAGGYYWDITPHPTDPNVLYLSGSGEGVYRTTDGGVTWQTVNEGLTAMAPRQLVTVAGQPDLVYALITGWAGIFQGTRGGQAWQFLPAPGADAGQGARMAIDPFTPARLYRGGNAQVLRSDDGGHSWPITGSLAFPAPCDSGHYINVEALEPDPTQAGVLLAGTTLECETAAHELLRLGAIYRSSDGGQSWATVLTATSAITLCADASFGDLAYDGLDPARVYAAITCSGLWSSVDSGQSWDLLGQGAPYAGDLAFVQRVAAEPAAPYRLFVNSKFCAALNGSCMYLSEDQGQTWRPTDDPFHSEPEQMLFAPNEPPVLYVTLADGSGWYTPGLYRTIDGGHSWTRAAGLLGQVPVYAVATVTATDRVILYAGTPGGVIEGGRMAAPDEVAPLPGTRVAAGVYRYTSRDRRLTLLTWEQVNENGFGATANTMVAALEVFDGQLYAGTWNDGGAQVWRTAVGRAWTALAPGWPPTKTGVLDLQAFGPYLYVGTDDESGGELWRTDGSAWEQVVVGGFGHAGNWGVDVLAVYSSTLYAATASSDTGSELWASPTGNAGSWERVSTPGAVGTGVGFSTLERYGDSLYVGGSYDGRAALWRTDGVEWSTVFTTGLDLNNTHVSAMAVFQDQLYLGLRNTTTGGEVWRSGDDQRWTRVVVNGLDNLNNSRPYGLIAAADQLYLIFTNYSGAEVWRSPNGLDWEWTNRPGWDDPGNAFADYLDKGAVIFHGDLYVGTGHDAGGEVWRLRLAPRIYLPAVMK